MQKNWALKIFVKDNAKVSKCFFFQLISAIFLGGLNGVAHFIADGFEQDDCFEWVVTLPCW